jgi:hypothetical protein
MSKFNYAATLNFLVLQRQTSQLEDWMYAKQSQMPRRMVSRPIIFQKGSIRASFRAQMPQAIAKGATAEPR